MSIGPDGELEAWPGAGMQMYTYLNPEEQAVWDKIDALEPQLEPHDRLFSPCGDCINTGPLWTVQQIST